MLGEVAERRGQFEAAEVSFQESLGLAREVDDFIWIVRCLCSLGRVAGAVGDLARAETYYRDSLAMATQRNMGPESAEVQLALGRLLSERLDRREEGCPLLQEAARRFAEMGMPEAAEAREVMERLGCAH
jgi:tetratricopeptide (TPR) repeat protein